MGVLATSGWPLDAILDLTWDQLWDVAGAVEDQRAAEADLLLRPFMKKGWRGYAAARKDARSRARKAEEARTNPKAAAGQDAALLAFFAAAGIRPPTKPEPGGDGTG